MQYGQLKNATVVPGLSVRAALLRYGYFDEIGFDDAVVGVLGVLLG